MKITDLRKELKAADKANVENAFVELYKSLNASSKRNVDAVLSAWLAGTKTSTMKKEKPPMTMEKLNEQVHLLDQYARSGEFVKKRSVLRKEEKSRWRFWAKDWIRQLLAVPADSADFRQSCELLLVMENLIRDAKQGGLFTAKNPFRSIGYTPYQLSEAISEHILQAEHVDETILPDLLNASTEDLWLDEYDDIDINYYSLVLGLVAAAKKLGRIPLLRQVLPSWAASRKMRLEDGSYEERSEAARVDLYCLLALGDLEAAMAYLKSRRKIDWSDEAEALGIITDPDRIPPLLEMMDAAGISLNSYARERMEKKAAGIDPYAEL